MERTAEIVLDADDVIGVWVDAAISGWDSGPHNPAHGPREPWTADVRPNPGDLDAVVAAGKGVLRLPDEGEQGAFHLVGQCVDSRGREVVKLQGTGAVTTM
ncbi:hypothetical protein [Embleya sp. NBC_00888]|uniref:hypothetical protein n=1 Tax=Embleya sp. NBC_00888 TaxID=2975960 RepID=UPI003865C43E